MYANPSFQRIKLIPANAYCDLESTPLNINFESVDNDSYGHICFHLENAPLAAALVKAINETLAAFAPVLLTVTPITGTIQVGDKVIGPGNPYYPDDGTIVAVVGEDGTNV